MLRNMGCHIYSITSFLLSFCYAGSEVLNRPARHIFPGIKMFIENKKTVTGIVFFLMTVTRFFAVIGNFVFHEFHRDTHNCCLIKTVLLICYRSLRFSVFNAMPITQACQLKYYFTYKQFWVVNRALVILCRCEYLQHLVVGITGRKVMLMYRKVMLMYQQREK